MSITDELLASGLIERVPADPAVAEAWMEAAHRHLAAGRQIAQLDRAGAYSLTYDAARKAVTAHMIASGLRTRAVPGSHQAVARYAVHLGNDPSLVDFDVLRRNRNNAEYGTKVVGAQEVAHALEVATAIVALVQRRLAAL
ncbi:MAG TPA: hypothetical protein VLB67_15350 [Acidimicrobiia bacterium]|nr:hypothetical protein [Acidimicrobiia bacterium]